MKNSMEINTGERIFLIHYNFEMGRKDLCNLKQLEGLVKKSNSINKIEHFWNYKFKRISKKDIKNMLEGANLKTDFLKLI